MRKNSQPFAQLQLNLLDQALYTNTQDDLNDEEPTISIRLVRKNFKGGTQPTEEASSNKSSLDAKTSSRAHLEHPKIHFESHLKLEMAKLLMDWMIQEGMELDHFSELTQLPMEKVDYLLKGNVGKLHFYELLHALTQFGYQASICLRSTPNYKPGKIAIDRI